MNETDVSSAYVRLAAAIERASYPMPAVRPAGASGQEWHSRVERLGKGILAKDPSMGDTAGRISDALASLTGAIEIDLVQDLLLHLAAWFGPLPASEANHHSGHLGLLQHSVEVGGLAADDLRKHWLAIDSYGRLADPVRRIWARAMVVAALLHDVGKIYDLELEVSGSGEVWNPDREPVAEFLHQAGEESVGRSRISYRPGRGWRHEAKGRDLIPRVVPASFSDELVAHAIAVFDAYSQRHDLGIAETLWPLPLLGKLLVAADRASARGAFLDPAKRSLIQAAARRQVPRR